jgi:hypothetical protein
MHRDTSLIIVGGRRTPRAGSAVWLLFRQLLELCYSFITIWLTIDPGISMVDVGGSLAESESQNRCLNHQLVEDYSSKTI